MLNSHVFYYLRFMIFILVGSLLLTSCDSRKTIVNSLDEKEANEIVVFLAGKGIDASKVQAKESNAGGGSNKALVYDISVSESKATEAMAILNMNGLPRRRGQNLLNLFSTGGLVPSDMEQKVRYQAGLAEQIASTIRKIDGILDADVQLSFPEEDTLNPTAEKKQKATASVYVKHQGVLDDPNSHLVTKIKRLVASSVNGLDFDNVTVIGDRARFSDVTVHSKGTLSEQDKQFVKVWTLLLAKSSVMRFQIIFFSFCLLILLLTLAITWIIWKIFPILQKTGGIKKLFELEPLKLPQIETETPHSEEEKKQDTKEEHQEEPLETT